MTRAWSCLLVALLTLPLTAFAGDIRKWVDAEGRVHFGDDATAPGRSQAVTVAPGNFLATVRTTAPRASQPVTAAGADLMARTLPAEAADTGAAEATATPPATSAPDCLPVEYKKISPRTGLVVRMRRFPCQPGLAPLELGPL